MDEKEFIETQKSNLKETIDFLNNKNKKNRELWVVNEFLSNLSVVFKIEELVPALDEPPDVIFREARFEIKVILDKGRKIDEEYKNKFEKAKTIKQPSDLLEPYNARQTPLSEILILLNEQLDSIKYVSGVCNNLDILFYANVSFANPHGHVIQNEVKWQNWRSVSVVGNGGWGIVLWANEKAPDFLKIYDRKVQQMGMGEPNGNDK